jgi:hypothetical protein
MFAWQYRSQGARRGRCTWPGGLCAGVTARILADGPPWPVARVEPDAFTRAGLREASFEDFVDDEEPPVRRFRVRYRC